MRERERELLQSLLDAHADRIERADVLVRAYPNPFPLPPNKRSWSVKDEHLELRRYGSQAHQCHPLLRRQFH